MGIIIGVVVGGIILLAVLRELYEDAKANFRRAKEWKKTKEEVKKTKEEVKKSIKETQRRSEEGRRRDEERRRALEEDLRKIEIQKKECPQKLREMTEYYIHSDLLHAILLELCQGDLSNRPIRIEVWSDKITAEMSEHEKLFYHFSEHRVPDLKWVNDETIEASPIIALAHAINHLLDDDYTCDDSPVIARLELKRINTF